MPSGVDASTGEVAARAVRATADRHLPRRQAGAVDQPRQEPRRRGRGDRHRHPARCAAQRRYRPDRRPRCSPALPRRRPTRPSSAPVTCWSSAARAGSPARRAWRRSPACARARATSPPACRLRVQEILASGGTPELMTRGLPERRGPAERRRRRGRARRRAAAGARSRSARGSGAQRGRSPLARSLARDAPLPLVLDADGLNAHAGRLARPGGARRADRADPARRRARPAARARER